jgi:hypothetical protein
MTCRTRICEALVLSAVLAMGGCGIDADDTSDGERETMSTTVDWLNNTGEEPGANCTPYDPTFETHDNGECGIKNSQREQCVYAGREESLFIGDYGNSRSYVCAKSKWLVKDTFTVDSNRRCENAVASHMLIHDDGNDTHTITDQAKDQAICCSSNQCGEILKGSIAGYCFTPDQESKSQNRIRHFHRYECIKDEQNIAKWQRADGH